MTAAPGKQELLAELAANHAAVQQLERDRLDLIAQVLNAKPPATWKEIGAALGQTASNAHRKYAKHLDVTVQRRVRVKPADNPKEG